MEKEILVEGRHGKAKIFTHNFDSQTLSQIMNILNYDISRGANTRIMPDTHAGKGNVVGYTAKLTSKLVPNIIGVDIGCGMLCVKLDVKSHKIKTKDLKKVDRVIRDNIPIGSFIHKNVKANKNELKNFTKTYAKIDNLAKVERSLGSLGGGNHFIEIGVGEKTRDVYLIIHSGSRSFGYQVASYHQSKALELLNKRKLNLDEKRKHLASIYKDKDLLKEKLDELKNNNYPNQLAYLDGVHMDRYIHDMKIAQEFASLNRLIMAKIIVKSLFNKELMAFEYFETVHNYIDFENNIIRKGAISAKKDERLIIPINMRDGSLLALGKGNKDWNYSAPHGAGRKLSRTQASDRVSLKEYEKAMKGIYSTSINKNTIDESPFAYKNMKEIIRNTEATIDIVEVVKPIYNLKA